MNNEDIMKMRKDYNKSTKKYKVNRCLYCDKTNVSFCNSHSVPKFILKNIAKNGMVQSSGKLMQIDLLDIEKCEKGTNNTGTFHVICRECDSKIFSNYENEISLMNFPTNKMLIEIALKNTLFEINKKFMEKGLHEYLYGNYGICSPCAMTYNIDYLDNKDEFIRLKKANKGKKNVEFDVFMWEKLPYKSPLTFQGSFRLYGDLEGNMVNDIYNYDRHIKMQGINFCVFPLSDCTIVMGFNDKSYIKNNRFIRQFVKKSLTERLEIVNYLNFLYSEDYYISPYVNKEIFENENLVKVCTNFNFIIADIYGNILDNSDKKLLNASTDRIKIPNLLSKQYKVS